MRAREALLLSVFMLISSCGRIRFETVSQTGDAGDGDAASFPGNCSDGIVNEGETATDCGGPCQPCATGRRCINGTDCADSVCENNVCQAATCADGVRNGDETDTDCGGSCQLRCGLAQGCLVTSDCQGTTCSAGKCAAASCMDGLRNGSESGVDCGGTCSSCPDGSACASGNDCASATCVADQCVATECDNQQKDSGETDVDCGGTCGASCSMGQACTSGSDCAQGVCLDMQCAAPSCSDGIKNQDESDVDCGGTCGNTCLDGQTCQDAGDCQSASCVQTRCTAPGCSIAGQLFAQGQVNPNNPCEVCDTARSTDAWSLQQVGTVCDDTADCTTMTRCDDVGQCVGLIDAGLCYIENQCWVDTEANPNNQNQFCSAAADQSAWTAASCSDGVINGDELAPDCGGSCPACSGSMDTCGKVADCTQQGWGYRACCSPGGFCGVGSLYKCSGSGYN